MGRKTRRASEHARCCLQARSKSNGQLMTSAKSRNISHGLFCTLTSGTGTCRTHSVGRLVS
eukprot:691998-Pleurochrysis_carterae.AAC.1